MHDQGEQHHSSSAPPTTAMGPPSRKRKPIRTYHCAFCNHLLVASTRDVLSLPRRKAPALDRAIILALPPPASSAPESDESEDEEVEVEGEEQSGQGRDDNEEGGSGLQRTGRKRASQRRQRREGAEEDDEYTILLATTTPDRRPVMIRREDGFEKRLLVRCGRCRAVVAYFLDDIHFLLQKKKDEKEGEAAGEEVEGESARGAKDCPKVVYVLPGALVETKDMNGKEIVVEREEWGAWEGLGAGKEKQ